MADAISAIADDGGSTTESEVYEFGDSEDEDFGPVAPPKPAEEPSEKPQPQPEPQRLSPSQQNPVVLRVEGRGKPERSARTATVSDSESSMDENKRAPRGRDGKSQQSSRDGKAGGGDQRREEKSANETKKCSAVVSRADRRVAMSSSTKDASSSWRPQSPVKRESAHTSNQTNCRDMKRPEKANYKRSQHEDKCKGHEYGDLSGTNHGDRASRLRSTRSDRHVRDDDIGHERPSESRRTEEEKGGYRTSNNERYCSSSRTHTERSYDSERNSREFNDRRCDMVTESSSLRVREHQHDFGEYGDRLDRYDRSRAGESEYVYEREADGFDFGRNDNREAKFSPRVSKPSSFSSTRYQFEEAQPTGLFSEKQRLNERDYYDPNIQTSYQPPQPVKSVRRDTSRDPRLARRDSRNTLPPVATQQAPSRPPNLFTGAQGYANTHLGKNYPRLTAQTWANERRDEARDTGSRMITRQFPNSSPSTQYDYGECANERTPQSSARKRQRSPSSDHPEPLIPGVDKKYIEQVRFFKITSRFVELELEKVQDKTTHDFLEHRQAILRGVKERLVKYHPAKFADVFNAIHVTTKNIVEYPQNKSPQHQANCRHIKFRLDNSHSQESGYHPRHSLGDSRQQTNDNINSALEAPRPSSKRQKTSMPAQPDFALAGVSKDYIDHVRLYKITSLYIEEELKEERRGNVRKYLIGRQETLQNIKERLTGNHPRKFEKVFAAIDVTSEDIEQHRYEKAFSNRVFRYRVDQEELDKRWAAIKRWEELPSNDLEWKQRELNLTRADLERANKALFDEVMARLIPPLFYRKKDVY